MVVIGHDRNGNYYPAAMSGRFEELSQQRFGLGKRLRAYGAESKILPEQTLGRGLRKMYPGRVEEQVSVVGTNAFMDFVESIQAEGVTLERKAMGTGTPPKAPLVVEVDEENERKNLDELDIEIPVMTPRVHREYKNLVGLDVTAFTHAKVPYREFTPDEQREIVFRDIADGEVTHTTVLDSAGVADYRSVIGYLTQQIMKPLRLVSGYDVLYGKVKAFIQDHLFDRAVELDDANTLRNLSELAASKTLQETFRKEINALTIEDRGDAEIRDYIKLRQTRPLVAKDQGYVVAKRSVFNRIIGDSRFELEFASFLEDCPDIVSYAKNYLAVHFVLDYVTADGNIANYYPDFLVKVSDREIVIVETKGLEDVDVAPKMARLRQWCEDINRAQSNVKYDFVYVDDASFHDFRPKSFKALRDGFREFKD
jgi:type III restriction enzyme